MPLVLFKPAFSRSRQRCWEQHASQLVAHVTGPHNGIECAQVTTWVGFSFERWDMRNPKPLRELGVRDIGREWLELFIRILVPAMPLLILQFPKGLFELIYPFLDWVPGWSLELMIINRDSRLAPS